MLLDIDPNYAGNKKQVLLEAEGLMHQMYRLIANFSTLQQVSDALKVLEEANAKILNPVEKVDQLKPPQTNTNRKGAKFQRGNNTWIKTYHIYVCSKIFLSLYRILHSQDELGSNCLQLSRNGFFS